MELYFILLAAGILSGILTILFGFAGGFVVVPLVYSTIHFHEASDSLAYGMAFKSAVATSLLLMVINSGLASYQQFTRGNIQRRYLFPIAYWIGVGAVIGTFISLHIAAFYLKWAFVAYLSITILDCLSRQLKSQQTQQISQRGLNSKEQHLGGICIGVVAAALGVGGSVMTVPLFRRCGLEMSRAVALANPLSMPVALAGCLTLIISQWIQPPHLGIHFWGYFYYPALICLILGGVIGMKITLNLSGKLSNTVHERGYIVLLTLVLLSILLT
ncbi:MULTISPECIES: sulfite exporter TauE/SafE family protein [unclassified Acinetobacter]|uniref:sulfite exporter TauE/SafE family protein n=1 Tax=unclassified Acinetobacter TaxID=196816 RepID=UPI0018A98EAC|nr:MULTISPECIES: sulfite exporter TauE/SafE family protein [unclassified Acinetobacter]MBJ9952202.1 sulfite exporter TauE/SafE family protein [Acinetobacter baumannii]